MPNLNFQISNKKTKSLNHKQGFTLIELIVVVAIISILTTVSVVSFNGFNDTQVFESTVSNFASTLNIARSKALSQIKPDACVAQDFKLSGYQVVISGSAYRLEAVCVDDLNFSISYFLPPETKLNSQISFFDDPDVVFFKVLDGRVVAEKTIQIGGFGKLKIVKIEKNGNILIQ